MSSTEVQRTLVKSPPELWAELSDPAALARHLGELGEIRITRVQPEEKVEWEAEGASGTITIKPSGWGTKVTLSVTCDPGTAPAAADQTGAEAVEAGVSLGAVPAVAQEPEAGVEPEHAPTDAGEPEPPAAEDAPIAPEHVLHEDTEDEPVEPEPVLHEDTYEEPIEPEPVLHEDDHGHEAFSFGDEPDAEHLHAGAAYDLPVDEEPLEDSEALPAEPERLPSESRRGFFGRMLDRLRRPRPEPIEEPQDELYEIDIEGLTGGFVRAHSEGATYAAREFGPEPAEGVPGPAPFAAAEHEPEQPVEAFPPGPEPEPEPVAIEPEAVAAEPEPVAAETLPAEPIAAEPEAEALAPEAGSVAADAGGPEHAASEPAVPETAPEAPAAGLGDELRAAEEAGDDRVQALLTATLDRLGAAHHRPFSRA